jgi:hypothetical protein
VDHTDSVAFSPTDIVNPLSLGYKLRHPNGNKVSIYLIERLAPSTLSLIQTAVEGSRFELQAAFANDLNTLLRAGNPLFEPDRFAGVKFSKVDKLNADIASMMSRQAVGDRLLRQNRYALESAFPDEISTKHIVDLLGEYLAHIAVLKQLLKQCQNDRDFAAYQAGWHVMGYYPRSLNAKIEAGYRELTTFLALYSDQGTKSLTQLGMQPPEKPSTFDRIERMLDFPRTQSPVI